MAYVMLILHSTNETRNNMNTFLDKIRLLEAILSSTIVTTSKGVILNVDVAFDYLANIAVRSFIKKQTIFFVGNGASASMASHISADLCKNARIKTEVFTDLSLITAVTNDIGGEDIFYEPLRIKASPSDILIAISSSGNSKNIIKAVDWANEQKMITVSLSAMSKDNLLRKRCTFNFYVPARTYGLAETAHTAILHHWVDITLTKIAEKHSHNKTDEFGSDMLLGQAVSSNNVNEVAHI